MDHARVIHKKILKREEEKKWNFSHDSNEHEEMTVVTKNHYLKTRQTDKRDEFEQLNK